MAGTCSGTAAPTDLMPPSSFPCPFSQCPVLAHKTHNDFVALLAKSTSHSHTGWWQSTFCGIRESRGTGPWSFTSTASCGLNVSLGAHLLFTFFSSFSSWCPASPELQPVTSCQESRCFQRTKLIQSHTIKSRTDSSCHCPGFTGVLGSSICVIP